MVLRYQGLLCVQNMDGLREQILEEAHDFRYSIYPGATGCTVIYGSLLVEWYQK